MTRNTLTFLATVGCLFALATSCKKPEETTQYATNKAGERLVERIDYIDNDNTITSSITLEYNSDGTLKTMTGWDLEECLFERRNNTLFMSYNHEGDANETSFDLNDKGWIILDRGWKNDENYRLTYDDNGHIKDVFKDDKLLFTFQWEDGNIVNEEEDVTYIPTQAHPSNIDWCAFFQTWRYFTMDEDNDFLIEVFSIFHFWGFSEGYLGNKCKGLPLTKNNGKRIYSYDFDEDGFISTIYINSDPCYKVTYLKK